MLINIRKARYEDYGLTEDDVSKIMQLCQGKDMRMRKIARGAAEIACPGAARQLCMSICDGISYTRFETFDPVPLPQEDFYAYRRKTIKIIKIMLDCTKDTEET